MAGTTTIAAGEKLQWKGAQDVNGSVVNAFTVKAYDGVAVSATAVQVSAAVAASGSLVPVILSTPLSIVPLQAAAGGWTESVLGTASSSSNTLQLATTTASSLTTSVLGTVSQINRIEMIVNVPQTNASYNGVTINVGTNSYFIGSIWSSPANSTYRIGDGTNNIASSIYKTTNISAGTNLYLQIDFNSSTGVSEVKYGTDATYATGSWISTANLLAPTLGASANISVGFKKYTETAALTVSKFAYYLDGTVLAADNIINLTGTLGSALASNKEIAVYAVALDGTVTKVTGTVTFTGLNWNFVAAAAIAGSNYQLRIVSQDNGISSLNTASTGLLSTKSVIAVDSTGTTPTVTAQSVLVDQNLAGQSAVSTVASTNSVADQTLKLKGTLSTPLRAGEQLWLYDDSTPLSEIRTTSTNWSSSATPTLSFAQHKLNVKVIRVGTGAINYSSPFLDISVQNINSPIAIKDDFGVAQTSNLAALTGYSVQREVTQVMPALSGWTQTPAGGSITATAAGWVLSGTDANYKKVSKTIGNSDNVTEVVLAFNAPSTTAGSNGVDLTFGSTSLFYGSRFSNTPANYTYNGGNAPSSVTAITAGNLAYLKLTKTIVSGSTVWQFSNSSDGTNYSNGNTIAWAANTNITLTFQKWFEGGDLTVQGIKYQQQSLLTDDTTPTLSGLLDGNMASTEELAIYSTTNSLATGLTTKLGVATVNASTREWSFTPTTALTANDYVLTPVVQAINETSISNAHVVYANKLVSINSIHTGLPTVTSNEVTIAGADFTYDLTAISPSPSTPTQVRVDKIDLTGTGNNKLVLAVADVTLAGTDIFTTASGWTFSSSSIPTNLHQMLISGNAGDIVQVQDGTWTPNGTVTNSAAPSITYNVYQNTASAEQLLLSQAITRAGTII